DVQVASIDTAEAMPAAPVEAAPVAAAPAQVPAVAPPGWGGQLGAAPTADGAPRPPDSARKKIRSLGQFDGFVQRFGKDGQAYLRARFGGFSGQSAANDMCKQLKQAKLSCLAMQSQG